jgi:hypothetical protein
VSEALDRLAAAAAPLLLRVDAALADDGAPPDDPVWPLLRQVRALPSDAVAAVAAWRADPLEAAEAPVRALARRCREAFEDLPRQIPWEGVSAEAYAVRWDSLRAHVLGPDADSVAGRLERAATYLGETADWMARSRLAVARALADVLGSAEAVALVAGSEPAGPAAARIAVHVLAPVAAACEEGHHLREEWHGRLGEWVYRAPSGGPVRDPGAVRVGD